MEPAAGDTVRERYRLAEELGTGGFSTVWRARDRERDRDVALKLPSFHAHDRETVLERFERERWLLEPFAEGLSHATVVRYLDGRLDSEPRYLAFEYLSGDPLVDKFGTGALGSAVRRRVIVDLAETLDFLHRNDVVYLDVKPENVIVRRSARPVLLDFNTAVRRSEPVEARFEPDQFKAPELLADAGRDASAGPWSDVHSWGKLAFYLLTGVKVLPENVPDGGLDPRSFGGSCSAALADVIQRGTAPAVDARYDDGTALAAAVARATGRGPRVLVTHQSGVTCAVADGDTIGRLAEDEPVPRVILSDPRKHVSPRHARFRHTPNEWVIEDTSLDGTYVADADGWTFVLSEDGYRTRRDRGQIDPERPRPPAMLPLPEGAVIAPVHPEYGIRLRVTTPDR